MSRSEEILVKISHLKDEVESRTKEIESLKEELKEIRRKEAERMMLKKKERINKMASFIKHNMSRTIIAEITWPEYRGEEYIGEVTKHHILKKGEYDLCRNKNNEWYIDSKELKSLLECVDNIYVAFE